MNEIARGRDQERSAIVTYLRHAAACHALNTVVQDPIVDVLNLYAHRERPPLRYRRWAGGYRVMARVNHLTVGSLHYGYSFHCPGCLEPHVIPTKPADRGWDFTGDEDRPTFTPSILVHPHGVLLADGTVGQTPRCHSFVRDGRIEFLSDSTHALAGQTVDLPEVK